MTLILRLVALAIAVAFATPITISTRLVAQAQQAQAESSPYKTGIEILGFKVGSDYYPLLDGKSPIITADSSDYPRTESEKLYRQQTSRRGAAARAEELRARGQLRSRIKVISDASWVKATVKNTGSKTIKAVDWDFAFPRFEGEKLALRYDVSTRIEIRPGEKQALKQPLPAGASKCKVIHVGGDEAVDEKGKPFDSVCGQGIHDGSHLKQETVSIKRIEYADGSVWQRQ